MKLFLIGFFALALTLGVGCKKENVEPRQESQVIKTSVKDGKTVFNYNLSASQIASAAEWPYDENVYPHSTGLCYCQRGPKCHGVTVPPCASPPCQTYPPY